MPSTMCQGGGAPSNDRAAPSNDRAAPSNDRAAPSNDRAAPSNDRAAPTLIDPSNQKKLSASKSINHRRINHTAC